MLIPVMAACGEKTPGGDVTTPSVTDGGNVTTEPAVTLPPETTDYPELPENVDYEDSDFLIFNSTSDYNTFCDFSIENDSYDIVNDGIFKRNSAVEDALGIVIKTYSQHGSTFTSGPSTTALKQDYTAAESNYDLCCIGTWTGPVAAQNGYVLDLYEVPYIDLEKPWWDQRANSDMGIGGKMFFTTGDIGITDNLATHCLLFSKPIAEEKSITDIYSLVTEGGWTWDKFEEYARMVSDDLNGDDLMDANDRYGVLTWNDTFQASFGGARTGIAGINENGELEVTMWSEQNNDLANRITTLLFDTRYSYNYMNEDASIANAAIMTLFPGGQGLFLTTMFLKVPLLRDSEMDFGIIPYPKLNAEQKEYGGYISATYSHMYCIETYIEDEERSGVVTELLAYQSMIDVTPAYYEHTLKGREARDEESIECLEIIFANRSYDLGVFYSIGSYTGSITDMMRARANRFQNIYESSKRTAGIQVKNINKKFVDADK